MHKFLLNLNYEENKQYLEFINLINKQPLIFTTDIINLENKLLWLHNKINKAFEIKIIDLPISNLPYVKNEQSEWFNISDIKKNKISKLLKLVYSENKGKKEKSEILQLIESKIYNTESADLLLRHTNQIVNTDIRGQVILGPGLSKLIRHLENLFINQCLYDFDQIFLPKLISINTWYKTGHIQKTLNEAYYVSRFITRDPEYSKHLKDLYLIDGELPKNSIKENTTDVIGGLTYAQCQPFWQYFENKIIPKNKLPICIFDRSGPSFRYEGKAIHSITRLDEFHRLESIFIIEDTKMNEFISTLKERFKNFLNKLELKYRILDVDSWMTTENKFVKTIDFELFLPYENRYLETLNLSNNSNEYISKFKIKNQNYKLYTGCSGLGLERLAYSFISQKGLNKDNWPDITKINIDFKSYIL